MLAIADVIASPVSSEKFGPNADPVMGSLIINSCRDQVSNGHVIDGLPKDGIQHSRVGQDLVGVPVVSPEGGCN